MKNQVLIKVESKFDKDGIDMKIKAQNVADQVSMYLYGYKHSVIVGSPQNVLVNKLKNKSIRVILPTDTRSKAAATKTAAELDAKRKKQVGMYVSTNYPRLEYDKIIQDIRNMVNHGKRNEIDIDIE